MGQTSERANSDDFSVKPLAAGAKAARVLVSSNPVANNEPARTEQREHIRIFMSDR